MRHVLLNLMIGMAAACAACGGDDEGQTSPLAPSPVNGPQAAASTMVPGPEGTPGRFAAANGLAGSQAAAASTSTNTTITASPSTATIRSGESGRLSLTVTPSPTRLKGYIQIRPADASAAQTAGITLTGDNGGRFGKECAWNDPKGVSVGAGRTCHVDYDWPADTGGDGNVVLQFVEYTSDTDRNSQIVSDIATLSLLRTAQGEPQQTPQTGFDATITVTLDNPPTGTLQEGGSWSSGLTITYTRTVAWTDEDERRQRSMSGFRACWGPFPGQLAPIEVSSGNTMIGGTVYCTTATTIDPDRRGATARGITVALVDNSSPQGPREFSFGPNALFSRSGGGWFVLNNANPGDKNFPDNTTTITVPDPISTVDNETVGIQYDPTVSSMSTSTSVEEGYPVKVLIFGTPTCPTALPNGETFRCTVSDSSVILTVDDNNIVEGDRTISIPEADFGGSGAGNLDLNVADDDIAYVTLRKETVSGGGSEFQRTRQVPVELPCNSHLYLRELGTGNADLSLWSVPKECVEFLQGISFEGQGSNRDRLKIYAVPRRDKTPIKITMQYGGTINNTATGAYRGKHHIEISMRGNVTGAQIINELANPIGVGDGYPQVKVQNATATARNSVRWTPNTPARTVTVSPSLEYATITNNQYCYAIQAALAIPHIGIRGGVPRTCYSRSTTSTRWDVDVSRPIVAYVQGVRLTGPLPYRYRIRKSQGPATTDTQVALPEGQSSTTVLSGLDCSTGKHAYFVSHTLSLGATQIRSEQVVLQGPAVGTDLCSP